VYGNLYHHGQNPERIVNSQLEKKYNLTHSPERFSKMKSEQRTEREEEDVRTPPGNF
jgi:hypothetical protein